MRLGSRARSVGARVPRQAGPDQPPPLAAVREPESRESLGPEPAAVARLLGTTGGRVMVVRSGERGVRGSPAHEMRREETGEGQSGSSGSAGKRRERGDDLKACKLAYRDGRDA